MSLLKNQQRRRVYQLRNGQGEKDFASRIICEKIFSHQGYQDANTVMWYSHCRSEVRTQSALLHELSTPKRIVIPYCTKDGQGRNKLGLWRLEDFDELMPGTWGILEPPKPRWGEPGKVVDPEQLDCVVVPGVAFDRNGGRLGNGAGYYDRLLKDVRADAVLLGVCFESQLVEQVIMEAHDVAMDFIITENTVYTARAGGLDG